RVAHTLGTELLEKAHRRLENAARGADVLAQEDHVLVARHLLRDARHDGLAIGQFRHAAPPSAHTSFSITSSEGAGDAFAVSVASSTLRIASASMSFSVGS